MWLYRSPYLATQRLSIFKSLHLETQISICEYSDLHMWVLRSPDLATQDVHVLVLKISRYGYSDFSSSYSNQGYSDLHIWVLKISSCRYSAFPDLVSQISRSSWTAWTLQMGPIGCPQTSLGKYDCTQCKIPKEGRTKFYLYFSTSLYNTEGCKP
jgi:hypothetical protein